MNHKPTAKICGMRGSVERALAAPVAQPGIARRSFPHGTLARRGGSAAAGAQARAHAALPARLSREWPHHGPPCGGSGRPQPGQIHGTRRSAPAHVLKMQCLGSALARVPAPSLRRTLRKWSAIVTRARKALSAMRSMHWRSAPGLVEAGLTCASNAARLGRPISCRLPSTRLKGPSRHDLFEIGTGAAAAPGPSSLLEPLPWSAARPDAINRKGSAMPCMRPLRLRLSR